ncbi:hypothetical protein GJ496_000161, partial [Pomphorhynchus laevis]
AKCCGQEFFFGVCKHLNIIDYGYFGIKILDDPKKQKWLEDDKNVLKQTDKRLFAFVVKFYAPDPAQLEDEYTRYLFALQIKRDLFDGTLQCCENTADLLSSFLVQAEFGDFMSSYDENGEYLQGRKFYQNQRSVHKIVYYHKQHLGLEADEADIHLLNTARKTEFYGLHPQQANDPENQKVSLCVCHSGIFVLQNKLRVNAFAWSKMRKISFKRKKLLIKLLSDKYGYYNDNVEFLFATRAQCKQFWKYCIENHGFFRGTSSGCNTADKHNRNKTGSTLKTKGSSFRYTGITMKESIERIRELSLSGQLSSNAARFKRFYEHSRRMRPKKSAQSSPRSMFGRQPCAPSLAIESHLLSTDDYKTTSSRIVSNPIIDDDISRHHLNNDDKQNLSSRIKKHQRRCTAENLNKLRAKYDSSTYGSRSIDDVSDTENFISNGQCQSSFTDDDNEERNIDEDNLRRCSTSWDKSDENISNNDVESSSNSSFDQIKKGRLRPLSMMKKQIVMIDKQLIPEPNTFSLVDDTVPSKQVKSTQQICNIYDSVERRYSRKYMQHSRQRETSNSYELSSSSLSADIQQMLVKSSLEPAVSTSSSICTSTSLDSLPLLLAPINVLRESNHSLSSCSTNNSSTFISRILSLSPVKEVSDPFVRTVLIRPSSQPSVDSSKQQKQRLPYRTSSFRSQRHASISITSTSSESESPTNEQRRRLSVLSRRHNHLTGIQSVTVERKMRAMALSRSIFMTSYMPSSIQNTRISTYFLRCSRLCI